MNRMRNQFWFAAAVGVSATLFVSAPAALADEGVDNTKPLLEIPVLHMKELWTVNHDTGGPLKFTVDMEDDGKGVIGFNFEGMWWDDGPGPNTWWASDLRLEIIAPNGKSWSVGGWDTPSDDDWGWPGAGSGEFPNDGPPGIPHPLKSTHFPWKDEPKSKEGPWQIHLWADFKDWDEFTDARWENIVISLHNALPAPGALALLGIAGVIGVGRRRRH